MELPQQVMDVDAIPGSGLFFYCSSAADAVTAAAFGAAETEMIADAITDADVKLSLSFCSSAAAVMAAASASVADANQQQFFSSCLKSRLCKEPIFLHIVYFLHIKYVNREKRSSYGL